MCLSVLLLVAHETYFGGVLVTRSCPSFSLSVILENESSQSFVDIAWKFPSGDITTTPPSSPNFSLSRSCKASSLLSQGFPPNA